MSGETCAALIAGHGGFHWFRCGKKAKGNRLVTMGRGVGTSVPVCGIHQRARGLHSDVVGIREATT